MLDPCDVNRLTPWSLGPSPPSQRDPPPDRPRLARCDRRIGRRGLPEIRARHRGVTEALRAAGNKGVLVLHRLDGDEAHFLFVSLWAGLDGIREFAGPDIDVARYFPDDARWLKELTPRVEHYLVPVFATRQ